MESDGEVVGLSVDGALCEASRDHVELSDTAGDADGDALTPGVTDGAGDVDTEASHEGVPAGDSDALCVTENSVD